MLQLPASQILEEISTVYQINRFLYLIRDNKNES